MTGVEAFCCLISIVIIAGTAGIVSTLISERDKGGK